LEGSEEELDRDNEEDCGKTADELEEFSNKMRGNLLQHQRAEEARAASGERPTQSTGDSEGTKRRKRKKTRGFWSQK